MNNADKQYLALLETILKEGRVKKNRTGVNTIGIFGAQMRFNLEEGFPLLTTKRVFFRGILHELLWFISGSTNIKYLVDNDVHIWDEWAFRRYKERKDAVTDPSVSPFMSQDCFIEALKNGQIDSKWGELGEGTYGGMWRRFPVTHYCNSEEVIKYSKVGDTIHSPDGERYELFVDQIQKVVDKLKSNPDDRRLIVSAWHPYWVDHCALPPCHCLFQFHTEELTFDERMDLSFKMGHSTDIFDDCSDEYVHGLMDENRVPRRRLNCQLYQRSCDTFLGVPFNIASYALLTHMVAHSVGMAPGTFVWTGGDVHIYTNHMAQVKEQLSRKPFLLPSLVLSPTVKDIFNFKATDISLDNYQSHPSIKAEVAV